jgi:hypothetical protein
VCGRDLLCNSEFQKSHARLHRRSVELQSLVFQRIKDALLVGLDLLTLSSRVLQLP